MSDTDSNDDVCVVMTYGQVYRIEGNGCVYIGSTKKRVLQQRLDLHLRDWRTFVAETDPARQNYLTSYKCFGGPEPATIARLEEIWFADLVELRMREQHHIDRTQECVNMQRAYSSPEHQAHLRREQAKRHYYRRSEEQKAAWTASKNAYSKLPAVCECSMTYKKGSGPAHRLTQFHIEYTKEHGDQSASTQRRLTLEQLVEKNERKKQQVVCECSAVIYQSGMYHHQKSKKHKDYMMGIVPAPIAADDKSYRTCECGSVCKVDSMYLHRLSKKHLAFVAAREAVTP